MHDDFRHWAPHFRGGNKFSREFSNIQIYNIPKRVELTHVCWSPCIDMPAVRKMQHFQKSGSKTAILFRPFLDQSCQIFKKTRFVDISGVLILYVCLLCRFNIRSSVCARCVNRCQNKRFVWQLALSFFLSSFFFFLSDTRFPSLTSGLPPRGGSRGGAGAPLLPP